MNFVVLYCLHTLSGEVWMLGFDQIPRRSCFYARCALPRLDKGVMVMRFSLVRLNIADICFLTYRIQA